MDSLSPLERAVRYRRQRAIDDGYPPGDLDDVIFALPAVRDEPVGNGWLHVGHVIDGVVTGVVGATLAVWWHPDTNRVKVKRPPEVDKTPRPKPESGPPIWWSLWGNTGCARPGYIYTREGQDYSPEDAAETVTHLRHDQGWTWRPVED